MRTSLTAGRSGIDLRWWSEPNMTVFSGKTSSVINEHFAPITQPLVTATCRPTRAKENGSNFVRIQFSFYLWIREYYYRQLSMLRNLNRNMTRSLFVIVNSNRFFLTWSNFENIIIANDHHYLIHLIFIDVGRQSEKRHVCWNALGLFIGSA